jgi:hypothetical protein
MSKRKNPHAKALGSLGGKARAKLHNISELNRANAIAGHIKLGHKLRSNLPSALPNNETVVS